MKKYTVEDLDGFQFTTGGKEIYTFKKLNKVEYEVSNNVNSNTGKWTEENILLSINSGDWTPIERQKTLKNQEILFEM